VSDKNAGAKTFADENESLFTDIVHATREKTGTEGSVIFQKGAPADQLILLEAGKLSIEGTDTTLVAGSIVGFCTPQYTSQGSGLLAAGRVFSHSFVAEAGTKYLKLQSSDLDCVLLNHGNAKLLGLTGAVVDPSQMLIVSKATSMFERKSAKLRKKKTLRGMFSFGKKVPKASAKFAHQMIEVKSELNAVKEQMNEMQDNMDREMKEMKTQMVEILDAIKRRDA